MLTENWKALEATVSKLVAKAWIDDEFCKRFINEPKEILQEAGFVLGDFVKVIVNQGATGTPALAGGDGGTTLYEINLPPKPMELSDEEIHTWSAKVVEIVAPFSC